MPSPRRTMDRAASILDVVDRQGTASYEALAEWLQVSTMTVRRDCEELIRLGKIIKTIGGIQQAHAPAYLYENPVRARIATNRAEKRAIAAKALELISKSADDFYRWRDHQSGAGQIARRPAHRTYHPH